MHRNKVSNYRIRGFWHGLLLHLQKETREYTVVTTVCKKMFMEKRNVEVANALLAVAKNVDLQYCTMLLQIF